MSAYDWCVVAAVAALLITASSYRGRDNQRWRQSTGRMPQTVADDAAEHRRNREVAQLEAWLAVPLQPRNTIPPQRQPRKDQP